MGYVFKVDDDVIKCRPYAPAKYCRYGGTDGQVPLGTAGRVIKIETDAITVDFKSISSSWRVDPSELKLKKELSMLDGLKKFYEKHQDIFFTIGLVLLVDYFLFNGALRTRVQGLIERLLTSAEKKLDGKE